MAEITAKMVADLRAATGLGMMECKKALVDCVVYIIIANTTRFQSLQPIIENFPKIVLSVDDLYKF